MYLEKNGRNKVGGYTSNEALLLSLHGLDNLACSYSTTKRFLVPPSLPWAADPCDPLYALYFVIILYLCYNIRRIYIQPEAQQGIVLEDREDFHHNEKKVSFLRTHKENERSDISAKGTDSSGEIENSSPLAERGHKDKHEGGLTSVEIQAKIIFRKEIAELRDTLEKQPAK